MSPSTNTVEHIVLLKVKNYIESSKINDMVKKLSSFVNIDSVLYVTVGPLLRNCPTTSDFGFTHMLHSCYISKENLEAYSVHPNHLDVARGSVFPICNDLMAVDWIVESCCGESDLTPSLLHSGSTIGVSFSKLRQNVWNEVKKEVLEVVGRIKKGARGISQFSWGENFSSEKAQGFSIASYVVFLGQKELEGVDWNRKLLRLGIT